VLRGRASGEGGVMSRRDTGTERSAEFLSALAFLDAYYGTKTPPDAPQWDDADERNAHRQHARAFGWRPPKGAAS